MVTHAATVIDEWKRDDEGFTASRRWNRRELTKPAAEFGECVMHLPAASVRKSKFHIRWMDGVRLRITLDSGE